MAHHEPFKHLGPLSWRDLAGAEETDSTTTTTSDTSSSSPEKESTKPTTLDELITTTFSNAQILIDSIPPPAAAATSSSSDDHHKSTKASAAAARARAQTDSAVHFSLPTTTSTSLSGSANPAASKIAAELRTEWKPVKLSAKENPMSISVFKLAARDGKGAWFARRSVHSLSEVASFEKWRAGLKREFGETSTVRSGEEVKSVRGLGAEKKVCSLGGENGTGVVDVFLVSVRFPGPTTPRDFVTALFRSDEDEEGEEEGKGRQFMLVSRPCVDQPECPVRNGFIRGTYESVEVVREVRRVGPKVRRTRSSVDLGRDGDEEEEEDETAIEWLMVTRSDPGGSVPRFMVEKGTPGGIVGDAGRFVSWLKAKSMEELTGEKGLEEEGVEVHDQADNAQGGAGEEKVDEKEEEPAPSGLYGMIASALEAAGSVVLPRLPSLQTTDDWTDSDMTDLSDYASAEDGEGLEEGDDKASLPDLASSVRSVTSSSQTTPAPSVSLSTKAEREHDKDLAKLQERHRRAHEKMIKNQERQALKRSTNRKNHSDEEKDQKAKDEDEEKKLRERHEKEVAKHQAKFERDMARLAEKKEAQRKKAEEKARKAKEKEERRDLRAELDKVKAERDLVVREMEMLREQVGALQKENTELVVKLGVLEKGEKKESD